MSYYDLIIPDFIKALELDNPINKRTQDVYSGVNCPQSLKGKNKVNFQTITRKSGEFKQTILKSHRILSADKA